ncbi:MAG: hypothetical protein JSW64_03145 [Candidatus Zixiibacteriota bacterium]|nr:MAG: hypothetical protein JSW64_03145 [candidate division Zixibacteria bacterium]
MTWKDILGILGFIFSILIFVLTRWERRKQLVINLYCDHLRKFRDEFIKSTDSDPEESFIVIQVVNTGTKPIVIDKNTVRLLAQNKTIQHGLDWFGKDKIPVPLNPGDQFEVGIFTEVLLGVLGQDKNTNGIFKISAELEDIQGKLYKTKNKYDFIGDVWEIEIRK